MTAATKDSWKRQPLPPQRVPLQFSGFFTDAKAEKIAGGHRPEGMDDRWFIYADEGWVYFHRSWTGSCIFGLKLEGSPAGVRVVDSWVSRDEQQYTSKDLDDDRKLLASLIEHYFPDER